MPSTRKKMSWAAKPKTEMGMVNDDPKGARVRRRRTERDEDHVTTPTRCTPEFTEKMKLLVAAGAPIPLACQSLGISFRTVEDWASDHFREVEPYKTFNAEMDKAKAAHAVGCQLRITKAARKGIWQADTWILERRYPEYWRPRSDSGQELPKVLDGMTPGQVLDIVLAGKK